MTDINRDSNEECTGTKPRVTCSEYGACFIPGTKYVDGIDLGPDAKEAEGPGIAGGIDSPTESLVSNEDGMDK